MKPKGYLGTNIKTYDANTRKITFHRECDENLEKRTLIDTNNNQIYFLNEGILHPLYLDDMRHPSIDGTEMCLSHLSSEFKNDHKQIEVKGFLTIDVNIKYDLAIIRDKCILVCGRRLYDDVYSNGQNIEISEIKCENDASCFLFGSTIRTKKAIIKKSKIHGCTLEGGKLNFSKCEISHCTFINCEITFGDKVFGENNTFYNCAINYKQLSFSKNSSYIRSNIIAQDAMLFINIKSPFTSINTPYICLTEHVDTYLDEYHNPISGVEVRYIEYPFLGKKVDENKISIDYSLLSLVYCIAWDYVCIEKEIYVILNIHDSKYTNEIIFTLAEPLPRHIVNVNFSRVLKHITNSEGTVKPMIVSHYQSPTIKYEPMIVGCECLFKQTISRNVVNTLSRRNTITITPSDLHSTFDFLLKEKILLQNRLSEAKRERDTYLYELRKLKDQFYS